MRIAAFSSLLIAASASAQSTYTTAADGELTLVAGLTTLTEHTAINSGATARDLALITDSSWSSTGVFMVGVGAGTSGGALAGSFGGGTYRDATHSIILVGLPAMPGDYWGAWDIQLLLSNGSYSNTVRFTSSDVVTNTSAMLTTNSQVYDSQSGSYNPSQNLSFAPSGYVTVSIGDFDLSDIGVTGIRLSGITGAAPDLTYIGVVGNGAIPEPSTYGLALGGLALAVAALRRRAKK